MPKRKFRRALIFITLLMLVTAFTIFQSPEYEKNYDDLEGYASGGLGSYENGDFGTYEDLAGDENLAGLAESGIKSENSVSDGDLVGMAYTETKIVSGLGQKSQNPVQLQEFLSTTTQPKKADYITSTGKEIYLCDKKPCLKVGEKYLFFPSGTTVLVKNSDNSYMFLKEDAFLPQYDLEPELSKQFNTGTTLGLDVLYDDNKPTYATVAQSEPGKVNLFQATPTGAASNEQPIIMLTKENVQSYGVLTSSGDFVPLKKGTKFQTENLVVVVGKEGTGTKYTQKNGKFKGKDVVKAEDGTYYTFDPSTQKLKKFTSGTITYEDGIGIIKKGEETRLYERTTDDGETFYTKNSAVTVFSQTEQTYDGYGKPLKNAVVKINGVYYAYDAIGYPYVVTDVGATDENGNNVFWSSQFNKFMTKDGKNAKGTVTYQDEKGNSQTVSLDNGLLPPTYLPPPTLQPSESVQVPEGVAAVSKTISNLNVLKGKIESGSTDTIKADNALVVEALKQAGATSSYGSEENAKTAVEEFQYAWILQNCGSDGTACSNQQCIGKLISGVCTADGIVGSKTIAALSATLEQKKASLYAAQQPEEESQKIGVEVSESGGGNVYTYTNTKGEKTQIPTDIYQELFQKMEKRDNNPQGKLTNEQIALLYDVMSQQQKDKMNLEDLKCGADYCYVDKNGWFTGDVIYKISEMYGKPVVKVYNGADGSDFEEEKGEGYESLTYYNFEGNYLAQVSSVGEDGVVSIYSPSGAGNLDQQDRVLKFKDISLTYFHSDSAWHGEYVGTDLDAAGKPLTHRVKIMGDGQIYLDEQLCSGSGLCQKIEEQYKPLIEHIQADPTLNALVASAAKLGATPLPDSLPQPSQGEAEVKTVKLSNGLTLNYGGENPPAIEGNVGAFVYVQSENGNTMWKFAEKPDNQLSPAGKKVENNIFVINNDNDVVQIKDVDNNVLCGDKEKCKQYITSKGLNINPLLEAVKELKKRNALPQEDAQAKAQSPTASAPTQQPASQPSSPPEPKPYTPPTNVAGLDTEGSVIACEDKEQCDQSKASFAFKHESILDGVEGSVYVKDKADKSGKELCASDQQGIDGCEKKNCDDVKGCKQTSDGDKYCTEFLGKSSCVNDPLEVTEHFIEECAKNPEYSKGTSTCTGANALSDKLYQSLDFEFRSRVEVVFGSLFDDWTDNAFSKLEYWMYDNVCHMNYYNAGESEVDLIAGGTIIQEHNFAHNLSYLGANEIIVTLGGEKEEVNSTIYRYAFSIQTIGPVHGVVYLYNKCTQKKSFSTTGTGWKDEFVVNNPLGVHRNHYATDQLTFDCSMEGIEECRFDHACLKILDNDDYVAPLCQKLEGDEIILNPETMDTDCGMVSGKAQKFK